MPNDIINPVRAADDAFGGAPVSVPSGVTPTATTKVVISGADGAPGKNNSRQVPAFGTPVATAKVNVSGDAGKPGTGTAAQSPAMGTVDTVPAALGATAGGLLQPGRAGVNVTPDAVATQTFSPGKGLPPTYNGGST